MNGIEILLVVGGLSTIFFFTYMSSRAQLSLWRKCRRRESCLQVQHRITLGKSHCR
jgi:hypothetical protein